MRRGRRSNSDGRRSGNSGGRGFKIQPRDPLMSGQHLALQLLDVSQLRPLSIGDRRARRSAASRCLRRRRRRRRRGRGRHRSAKFLFRRLRRWKRTSSFLLRRPSLRDGSRLAPRVWSRLARKISDDFGALFTGEGNPSLLRTPDDGTFDGVNVVVGMAKVQPRSSVNLGWLGSLRRWR